MTNPYPSFITKFLTCLCAFGSRSKFEMASSVTQWKNIHRIITRPRVRPGNTRGGSITVQLTSCLTGLDESVLQIKTKIVSSHTADSKPVKQEVNGTVILPPSVFPGSTLTSAN